MSDVQRAIREVLKITREVEAWRAQHNPATEEWHILCGLADAAQSLIFALPADMLPDDERRTPNHREYELVDALLSALAKEGER
jgi:hypothetical protein